MVKRWRRGIVVVCLVGCGVEPSPAEPHPGQAMPHVAPEAFDPLRVRAREVIEGGHGDPALVSALLASPRAAHRRAGRILAAMTPPPPELVTPAEHASARSAKPGNPMLASPSLDATGLPSAPAGSEHGPKPVEMAAANSEHGPKPVEMAAANSEHGPKAAEMASAGSEHGPKPGRESADAHSGAARVRLEGVGLRSTPRGAELELRAKGGLMVGVAHQPAEGIVRLVLDSSAASQALSARPRVTGARVTEVHRVGTSIFVTVMLDPGWRLGGTVSTRRGARVRFERAD